MKSWITYATVAAFIAVVGGSWFIGSRLSRIPKLEHQLSQIRNDLQSIHTTMKTEQDTLTGTSTADDAIQFFTVADATNLVNQLGQNPSAEKLAEVIGKMDSWFVKSDEEQQFNQFKLAQQSRLREAVKAEVAAHQAAALKASSGFVSLREHTEAGRILVLFPVTDDAAVIDEAKQLASQQAETANRLEVIRRQRYNRWAIDQIEKALDYYNANVSRFNPFSDNSVLIDAVVNNLGAIDPVMLEPSILELYNYVLDRTKGSLSEKNKVELAKRLTAPSISRKTLGDL